jgi:hypothetical protein
MYQATKPSHCCSSVWMHIEIINKDGRCPVDHINSSTTEDMKLLSPSVTLRFHPASIPDSRNKMLDHFPSLCFCSHFGQVVTSQAWRRDTYLSPSWTAPLLHLRLPLNSIGDSKLPKSIWTWPWDCLSCPLHFHFGSRWHSNVRCSGGASS